MTQSESIAIHVDKIDPARAAALLAVLDLEPKTDVGTELPPFAQHAFFWDPSLEANLARDGHPVLGGMVPDFGLPVRMWAGGRLRQHTPLRAGVAAERTSRLVGVTQKTGRSGKLAFVTLRLEIRQRGAPVLTEDQDIVYREAGALTGAPPRAETEADERRAFKASAITLFRYSALTFNAHRVHYDADYAREEGYPGLLVHGPLMATRLAMMAAERHPGLPGFAFRATAPLYLGDVAWLCRVGNRYWVEGPGRRICMTAEAGG